MAEPPAVHLDDRPAGATLREVWRDLGADGTLASVLRSFGVGAQPDRPAVAMRDVLETVDAGCSPGVTLGVCVPISSSMPLLAEGRTPVLQAAFASALAGESTVALAATDAAASGSSIAMLDTTADVREDRVVLHGEKRWITGAADADELLVLARHADGPHFTSFTFVLVPADADGVAVEPVGTRFFAGSEVAHVSLAGVAVERDRVIGRIGEGLALFARHMARERLASAYWAIALARRVLLDTRERLQRRPAGDGVLWSNAAVRERYARCAVAVRAVDALAAQCDPRRPDGTTTMALKAASADALELTLRTCADLQGADGFLAGGVQELRGEAAMFGIAGGATGAMLEQVAERADKLLERRPA